MKIIRRDASFIVFSVLLLAATAGTFRVFLRYATDWSNTNSSQALLIPFVSGALIYLSRKSIFERVSYSLLPGLCVLALGAGLLGAEQVVGANWGQGDRLALRIFSLLTMWLGGFLLFYGASAFRAALFPLLFLFFCVPIPSPILEPVITVLQHGSADVAYAMLKLSGTPVHRTGVVFTLPDLVVEVAPQCSGINSGISLLILSLLAGHLLLKSWWRRGALLIALVPILLFKNALRISTLSLLAVHIDHSILTSRLHREGGIPFFGIGLLLLYPVLTLLVKSERKRAETTMREAHL